MEDYPMKKYLVVFFVLAVAFTLIACGGGQKKLGGTVKGQSFVMEGWVDNNTYRIVAAGAPGDFQNKIQRQQSAQRAAMLYAQYMVLEKFKGSRIEGAAGMADFQMTGIAIAQEVEGHIKNGSVRKVTFDKDDNAEIIYEVRANDLRRKVGAAEWR